MSNRKLHEHKETYGMPHEWKKFAIACMFSMHGLVSAKCPRSLRCSAVRPASHFLNALH